MQETSEGVGSFISTPRKPMTMVVLSFRMTRYHWSLAIATLKSQIETCDQFPICLFPKAASAPIPFQSLVSREFLNSHSNHPRGRVFRRPAWSIPISHYNSHSLRIYFALSLEVTPKSNGPKLTQTLRGFAVLTWTVKTPKRQKGRYAAFSGWHTHSPTT